MSDSCTICGSEMPDGCRCCPVCGHEIHLETPGGKHLQGTARDLHRKGTSLLKQGDTGSALPLLLGAVRMAPEESRFWNSLGVCQHKAGMIHEAKESFQKAVALSPSIPAFRENLEKAEVQEKELHSLQKSGGRPSTGIITGILLVLMVLATFTFFILLPALTPQVSEGSGQAGAIQVNKTAIFLNDVTRIAAQDRPADPCPSTGSEHCDEWVRDLYTRFEHAGMDPVIIIGTDVMAIRSMDDLGDPWIIVISSDGRRAQVSQSGEPALMGDQVVVRGVLLHSPDDLDHLRALGRQVDNETSALHDAIVQYNETVLYGTGTSLYWYDSDAGVIADREGAVVRNHDESLADISRRLTEFLHPGCLNTTVNISHGKTILTRPSSTPHIDHDRKRAYTMLHESLVSVQRGDEEAVEIIMGSILEVVSPLPPEERAFFQDCMVFVSSLCDAVRFTKDEGEPGSLSLQDIRDDLARASGSVKKAEQVLPLLNASGYIGSSDKSLLYETLSMTKSRICQKAERWQVPFYNPDCSSMSIIKTAT